MFAYPRPLVNPGVSSITKTYVFSIPTWWQEASWPQSNANNSTHPNQAYSGRLTYLAQPRNSTRLSNEDTQPH